MPEKLANEILSVTDPYDTGANQLYDDRTGVACARVRAGRQSVKLDKLSVTGTLTF